MTQELGGLVQPLLWSGGAMALTLYGFLAMRVRWRRWWAAAQRLGLAPAGATGWGHAGVFRGRAVTLELDSGEARLSVRVVNRARLLDHVRAEDPLPTAPWLTAFARAQLSALGPLKGNWRVCVEGRTLTLVGAAVRPERLEYLLNLACDLAEGVDSVASGRTARLVWA